eukprot:TRINITY_DN1069_c0_g6_i2.p1 TRINITY_DN1069_c0_g6~~TRINITY_DN1069_c0_g6_i2.p1  ORF type:complete len:286 (-),score=58.80 TRINITY_DN1069_c0_g6_i2:196-1053(-)
MDSSRSVFHSIPNPASYQHMHLISPQIQYVTSNHHYNSSAPPVGCARSLENFGPFSLQNPPATLIPLDLVVASNNGDSFISNHPDEYNDYQATSGVLMTTSDAIKRARLLSQNNMNIFSLTGPNSLRQASSLENIPEQKTTDAGSRSRSRPTTPPRRLSSPRRGLHRRISSPLSNSGAGLPSTQFDHNLNMSQPSSRYSHSQVQRQSRIKSTAEEELPILLCILLLNIGSSNIRTVSLHQTNNIIIFINNNINNNITNNNNNNTLIQIGQSITKLPLCHCLGRTV